MANNRDEAGKGTPRPGEMPASRRPYATIDARATEIEGPDAPVGMGGAKPAADSATSAKPSEPNPTADPVSPSAGARVASALALLGSRRRAIRLATNLVANAAGSELVGDLVAHLFDQAVASLGYYRLP